MDLSNSLLVCLQSQAGQADRHLASKRMEITVNCPESSSLCPSDSEKASMAQVQYTYWMLTHVGGSCVQTNRSIIFNLSWL